MRGSTLITGALRLLVMNTLCLVILTNIEDQWIVRFVTVMELVPEGNVK